MSLHTKLAGSAREIGGDAVRGYLDIEAVIAAAKASGSDCVHPGYGFLSENTLFAERCKAEGLRFIGPSPASLKLFGDKVAARAFAQAQGIPVIPGAPKLASSDDAKAKAKAIGYPVMLKASAGGGGRGMRAVTKPEEMDDAFARCQGEAEAAFGDRALFLEKIVPRPRHIEVQVLGDGQGNVVHLFERDCSVQLRNQKVVEVAPAPNLDEGLRQRILADAVKLARAATYENAGTVEFLVNPETGEHFFIECNPRIQVEHTITEQVMGFDLVEAQFRIAAGASLAALGLADQKAVGTPRGFAVQARVVAQGTGTLSAYREPSGPGVRVDACGYVGLAPPPQFDPLLAKLICQSGSSGCFDSAVDRTRRALDEFHIVGVPTNGDQLRAILAHPDFRAGNARTTLLAEAIEPAKAKTGALQFLDQQVASLGRGRGASAPPARPLPVPAGHEAIESPHAGSVVDIKAREGAAGEGGRAAVRRQRHEDGDVRRRALLRRRHHVGAARGRRRGRWQPDPRRDQAGGRRRQGRSDRGGGRRLDADARQGRGAAGHRPQAAGARLDRSRRGAPAQPPQAHLSRAHRHAARSRQLPRGRQPGGLRHASTRTATSPSSRRRATSAARAASRAVPASSAPTTSPRAAAMPTARSATSRAISTSSRSNCARPRSACSTARRAAAASPPWCPSRTASAAAKESTGAIKAGRPRVVGGGGSFLPGHLGSTFYTEQLASVPVVNLLLGSVVGIGAAKAVLGHFSVMVRDISQLFVAGPPVVSHAMGYDVTKEDLGGWHIHCRNGSVDNLAETEEEAMAQTRRFLSYLPSSVYEAPPVSKSADPADRREEELLTLVPRKRTATFDVRRAIRLLADKDSFFEVGPLWGTDQVTGFVRMNGYPMGVIASDSRHVNGGALTADGCDKLKRHLDVCDLFHLPVLNLVDNPGFAVGIEHEIAGTIRKGGEWMVAFAQVTVPIFTVLMRRSFGVAGNNYATPRSMASVRVAWPSADVGGIPPEGGIEAAYKRQLAEAADPAALRAEINARIESVRGPIGPLNRFEIEEMIDPRDTRRLACEWVADAWRLVSQPSRLVPRPLQFRP